MPNWRMLAAAAGGAGFRHLALMIAGVANKQHAACMPGVLGIAAAAAQHESAVAAKHVGGAAAAIQKENCLFFAFQYFAKLVF